MQMGFGFLDRQKGVIAAVFFHHVLKFEGLQGEKDKIGRAETGFVDPTQTIIDQQPDTPRQPGWICRCKTQRRIDILFRATQGAKKFRNIFFERLHLLELADSTVAASID